MRSPYFLFFLIISCSLASIAQDTLYSGIDTAHKVIRVHIIHGSKPKRDYSSEGKVIGGKLGGHVMIQMDNILYGFNFHSDRIHLFSHQQQRVGAFEAYAQKEWEQKTKKVKVTTFYVRVTAHQYKQLKAMYRNYIDSSPYDYAFLGMRCASSCYKMLADIGVFPPASNRKSIRKAFHPRQLRKQLVRLADEKNYQVVVQKGRSMRNWEGDGKF